jgi:fructokinase
VRGSREDFEVLYKMSDPNKVYNAEISFYCKKFIYTNGANPVVLRADSSVQREYPATETETVSTIGAGDNFNAGFIYGMLKYGITRNDIDNGLSTEQWDKLMASAQLFSAECCKSIFNYVSPEFGKQMKASFNEK